MKAQRIQQAPHEELPLDLLENPVRKTDCFQGRFTYDSLSLIFKIHRDRAYLQIRTVQESGFLNDSATVNLRAV